MAFVGVESSSEAHGGHTPEQTEHDFALVARDGAVLGKARNVTVLHGERGSFQRVGEFGQAGPANDSDLRRRKGGGCQFVIEKGASEAVGDESGVHDSAVRKQRLLLSLITTTI